MKRAPIDSLSFKNLSFRYESDEVLFDNLTFDFPQGEKVRLRLESGQGSSTFMQLLGGLRLGRGEYQINGNNIFEMSFEEFLPYRLNIGYSFDYGGLIANKTLRENLLLPLQYHRTFSGREQQVWVMELLHRLGVGQHADKRPAMVTGGVRKAACVLRSLVMKPELILFDDPTTGLHPDQVNSFIELIEDMRREGHLKHLFFVSRSNSFLSQFDHKEIFVSKTELTQLLPESQAVS